MGPKVGQQLGPRKSSPLLAAVGGRVSPQRDGRHRATGCEPERGRTDGQTVGQRGLCLQGHTPAAPGSVRGGGRSVPWRVTEAML